MILADIPEALVVRIDDVRASGLCVSGSRRWFDDHRLDFRSFIANGMPAKDLFLINDAYAERAIQAAIAREANRG